MGFLCQDSAVKTLTQSFLTVDCDLHWHGDLGTTACSSVGAGGDNTSLESGRIGPYAGNAWSCREGYVLG